ncbi:hypothetical protein [Nocardia sp. NPDC020380]|uniref:hypothetical protein n=1 Tax=Nocardia sp. NPDC020380 TaxID=3364309 RepID=UPI00378A8C5D
MATGLDDQAAALDVIKNALDAAVEAGKGSWGNDEYGDRFSGGDNGYDKRQPILENTITSVTARLRSYSKGLNDGATKLEQTEKDNADGFKTN